MSIYFHIGMGKAGSSFLQQDVFPNFQGIEYINHFKYDNPLSSLFLDIYYKQNPWQLDLDAKSEKIGPYLQNKDNALFSWESLIGSSYTNFHNHFLFADTVKHICPSAKIIFITRKQDDYLHSQYMQAIHMGSAFSINYFLNYKDGSFGSYTPSPWKKANLDMRILNYMNFVATYIERFGKENILVLPFELLRDNKELFIKKLEQFTGSNFVLDACQESSKVRNKSYSLISYYIAILVNGINDPCTPSFLRLTKKVLSKAFKRIMPQGSSAIKKQRKKSSLKLRGFLQNGLDKLFYIKANLLTPKQRQDILSFHRESNIQLDKLFNLNLEKFGYY